MQGVCSSLSEVWTKAVAPHILHFMLVRKRRDGALRILLAQLFPQEDEVCKSTAHGELGFLEGLVVGLRVQCKHLVAWRIRQYACASCTDLCGDEIRDILVLGAWLLLLGAVDERFQAPFAEVLGHADYVSADRERVAKIYQIVFSEVSLAVNVVEVGFTERDIDRMILARRGRCWRGRRSDVLPAMAGAAGGVRAFGGALDALVPSRVAHG